MHQSRDQKTLSRVRNTFSPPATSLQYIRIIVDLCFKKNIYNNFTFCRLYFMSTYSLEHNIISNSLSWVVYYIFYTHQRHTPQKSFFFFFFAYPPFEISPSSCRCRRVGKIFAESIPSRLNDTVQYAGWDVTQDERITDLCL